MTEAQQDAKIKKLEKEIENLKNRLKKLEPIQSQKPVKYRSDEELGINEEDKIKRTF